MELSELVSDVSGWVDLLDGLGFGAGTSSSAISGIGGDIRELGFDLAEAATDFVAGTADNLASIISGLSGAGWKRWRARSLQDLTQVGGIFDLALLNNRHPGWTCFWGAKSTGRGRSAATQHRHRRHAHAVWPDPVVLRHQFLRWWAAST